MTDAVPLLRAEGAPVLILQNGVEHLVTADAFRSRFQVDDVIRFHAEDFDLIPRGCRTLVHFNLGSVANEVGRRYALVPIVRPGRRLEEGREILPVIDPCRLRTGTCVEVLRFVCTARVPLKYFSFSLENIRDSCELERALIRRYKGVFPGLSVEDIPAQSCTMTCLALS